MGRLSLRGTLGPGCYRREIQTAKQNPDWKFIRSLNSLKSGAERRSISWSIGDDEARVIMSNRCRYCGDTGSGRFGFNGIDRVDSGIGYVLGNCVPCCGTCNMAKGVKSLSEFEQWMSRMTEFRIQNSKKQDV